MGNKVKRPVSVWIAQALFVFYVLIIVLASFLVMMLTQPSERSFVGVLLTTILSVVLIALTATAFWGMATRRSYGRWLGVSILSFMSIFAHVGNVLFPSNFTKPMATKIMEILFSIFVFVVTLHIALSDKVGAFFTGKVDSAPLDRPPPPSIDA